MSEIMVLLFLKRKVAAPDNHSVKVCFGANKLASYTTSDVAPIILKDVQIGLEPGSIKYEWSLEQAVSDTLLQDKFRQMTAFISNPEWIINSHMYWKHKKTLSFSSKTFPVTFLPGLSFTSLISSFCKNEREYYWRSCLLVIINRMS